MANGYHQVLFQYNNLISRSEIILVIKKLKTNPGARIGIITSFMNYLFFLI